MSSTTLDLSTATSTAPKAISSKSKATGSSSERKLAAANTTAEKLKTVVRRLPPNLPEEVFWQSVQPWVSEETVSWRAFYPGKIRKKYNINKENIPSRAYIAFKSAELLAEFSQAYDGHLFRDKSGHETQAVVEFAPYQKVPSEKKKTDPRIGTIEQDEDYISFLASLKAPTKPSEQETLEALIASTQQVQSEPKTTPLLEALRAEKSAAKDKEAILKNHAHYHLHSEGYSSGRSKKDDSRRRGGAPAKGGAPPDDGKKRKRGKKGAPAANSASAADGSSSSAAQQDSVGPPPKILLPSHRGSKSTRARDNAPPSPRVTQQTAEKVEPSSTSNTANSASTTGNNSSNSKANTSGTANDREREQRRPRPTIGFGLSSRQFEAALSGVVPGDRRPRREREKKTDGSLLGSATSASSSGPATNLSPGPTNAVDDSAVGRIDSDSASAEVASFAVGSPRDKVGEKPSTSQSQAQGQGSSKDRSPRSTRRKEARERDRERDRDRDGERSPVITATVTPSAVAAPQNPVSSGDPTSLQPSPNAPDQQTIKIDRDNRPITPQSSFGRGRGRGRGGPDDSPRGDGRGRRRARGRGYWAGGPPPAVANDGGGPSVSS